MALKDTLMLSLVAGSVAFTATAQDGGGAAAYDERVVEEVVVQARGWRKEAPELEIPDTTPRWEISDETREKMQSRMQFGYDPVLEEIRNTDNRVQVRGNMAEPEPSTVFRVSF
ncbi:hypothetical protein [Gilvimarinus xylanilyticus]|uniref:Uncharacterized protein n=1 Tax=Gilvimarinus xylanilyticus TaxID=2944139 RepID=A0A9X2I298_9GAMM|nr:hypothetical protein [Gilvimarinus xylanilyticus]MCP8899468.1 hypothetical protein [Gilvimarinus xylanilyticus]